jgi:hypothetical protein
MAAGKRISTEQFLAYLKYRAQGTPQSRAAQMAGFSVSVAQRFDAGDLTDAGRHAKVLWKEQQRKLYQHEIKDTGKYSDVAREALDDIELFARRYFGIILRPWQKDAADRIVDLYTSPEEEYVVINVAPGSGKTTFFCKILPAWITCRDRTVRGLQGSNVQRLADMNVRQLRREFERTLPIKGEPKEVGMGLAIDAVSTLPRDYGNFKPENAELWRGDTFVVAQPNDAVLADKEPTWSAFGRNTGFLGFRYDFVIWDDVYDRSAMRSAEAREELRRWWDDIAETRLEPGGLMILQGQRLSAEDIYRYALDKVRFIETDDDEFDEVAGQKYHHIKYVAHDEHRCQKQHKRTDPPWPEGCLLDPRRLPYSKLRGIQERSPEQYAVVYQQEDVAAGSTLVNPLWVTGGTDADGITYPGCWDDDRDLWEIPHGAGDTHNAMMIATADPSPTKFWAIQCWYVNLDTGFKYLMENLRQTMDSPSFLDWNVTERRFTGIAEEWWHITKAMGHPITHWIIEANAAQKFIMQYDFFKRWASQRNVELIAHYTHSRNKTDPDYGVWMLAQEYKYGRCRFPGKSNTYARPHSLQLISEAQRWTPDREHVMTDDCVMAQWFLEHNLPKLRPPVTTPTMLRRPSWVRNRRYVGAMNR